MRSDEAAGFAFESQVDVISLRGELRDITSIGQICAALKKRQYKLVIIDAFYRALPTGTDENDNGAIAGVYNMIDKFAADMGCGFVLIHHSSKGNQAGKSVTDVGAGAGSQSRAADTHLVIRPHRDENIFVLEASIRSFAPIEPIALDWDWPLFTPTQEVDTSALLGVAKPKQKNKMPDLAEFVDSCIGINDPCSKRSVIYQANQVFEMSERKAVDMLELAIENDFTVKMPAGSKILYVKKRIDTRSEKAHHAEALIAHDPFMDPEKVSEVTGLKSRQLRRIRSELGV